MPPRLTKEERRRQLLAAAQTVFVEKGFQAATVDDIVSRVDVAHGTFYLYFSDKRAVFEALVDEFLQSISSAVRSIELGPDAAAPIEQLHDNIRRVVSLSLREPAIVKLALLDASGLDPALDDKLHGYYEALRALIDESLEQGQTLNMVRAGNRRVMVAIGLGGLKEVLVDAVGGRLRADPDELTEEIMQILQRGLLISDAD